MTYRHSSVSTGKVRTQWKKDLMILNTTGGVLLKIVVKPVLVRQGVTYTAYTRVFTKSSALTLDVKIKQQNFICYRDPSLTKCDLFLNPETGAEPGSIWWQNVIYDTDIGSSCMDVQSAREQAYNTSKAILTGLFPLTYSYTPLKCLQSA